MVRAIMHGRNGAMGRVIAGLAENDEDISIVAGIDIADNKDTSFPVFTSLDECTVKADVMIDFSIAKATDTMLSWCERTGMPVVVCTTGLSEEQISRVAKVAERTAVLRSANMSLGVNVLLKLVRESLRRFWPRLTLILKL